jgi:hypothetical protein
LAKKTISGGQLAIQAHADRAAKFIMTSAKTSVVAKLIVDPIATVVGSLKYGIWYSPSTIRTKVDAALFRPN